MNSNVLAFAVVSFVFMLIFLVTYAMSESKKDALEIWSKVYLPLLGLIAAAWLGQSAAAWLRGG